ncbi:GntR family transcriptional regulator [Tissierella pigra]|uniref:GntR family transcriptional regulator n=1 Tax=Tissierella pigra TaxID=2607614 RepID=A0A6N7Y190_9FIRM|nr:GntR family transcriptional regulator [Tissierella pigra]MBU5427089.1 GntR family transcriptional regulator [Tissierella pigra]MSU01760.1 GntR family transcriptional regulator [Tissierella pigra]
MDRSGIIPLYYQLMDEIIKMIEKGNLQAHDQLPSERELCNTYNISRSTVRQAIQELENEGYIYRVHGKGTFISPEIFKQSLLKIYSFTEEMKKLGKTPSSKVLSFDIISCDEKLSRKMKLNQEDKVYVFTRLRLADLKPMMLETSFVPCDRFPNLTKEELESTPMYDIFMKKYNANFTKAEEIFQAVLTRELEADLLEYQTGLPSMMIERVTYENDFIIEYTKGVARGDKFRYQVVLNK